MAKRLRPVVRTISRLAWIAMAAVMASCGGGAKVPPRTAASSPYRAASTPLPSELRELGSPCTTHVESPGRVVRCGAGARVAIVLVAGYTLVTGHELRACSEPYCVEDDPLVRPGSRPPPRTYPPKVIAKTTWARSKSGSVAEQEIRADGPYLWIVTVRDHDITWPTATFTGVDRRFLSLDDERWLREALLLPADTPLGDDGALMRALAARPSLGAAVVGELPTL